MKQRIRECYLKLHGEADPAGLEKFCEILIGQMQRIKKIPLEECVKNLNFGSLEDYQKNGNEELFDTMDGVFVWWEGENKIKAMQDAELAGQEEETIRTLKRLKKAIEDGSILTDHVTKHAFRVYLPVKSRLHTRIDVTHIMRAIREANIKAKRLRFYEFLNVVQVPELTNSRNIVLRSCSCFCSCSRFLDDILEKLGRVIELQED